MLPTFHAPRTGTPKLSITNYSSIDESLVTSEIYNDLFNHKKKTIL